MFCQTLMYEGSEEIGGELKRESSYSYHVSFYKEDTF